MFLHRGKPQNLPAKYFWFNPNYIAIDGPRIDGEKKPRAKLEKITTLLTTFKFA